MKAQFRKGFIQRGKKGSYFIQTMKIGGRKIAVKWRVVKKEEKS